MDDKKIKILLVTEYFYPENNGGTELYVYNLAKSLANSAIDVSVLTCSDVQKEYFYDNIHVFTIPFNFNLDKKVITGQAPSENLQSFVETLQKINPTVVHFHTITTSINLFHFEKTKELGYKVIFTSHIPAHICLRGDLLRYNKVCDGYVEVKKCLDCYHESLRIPRPVNLFTSFIVRKFGPKLALTNAAKNKLDFLEKLNKYTDAIVLVSQWQKSIFEENNFNPKKLFLCRQAIDSNKPLPKKIRTKTFTIGFIGRITKVKGLPLLLKAFENLKNENINLSIVGIKQNDEIDFFNQIKQIADSLDNCKWFDEISNDQIPFFLSKIDVLCVPSQWLETGPFVAYEALQNNVPVLASNIGGLKEIVTEGVNGWFFNYNDVKSLEAKIKYLSGLYEMNNILTPKIVSPRSTESLANEMINIYLKPKDT